MKVLKIIGVVIVSILGLGVLATVVIIGVVFLLLGRNQVNLKATQTRIDANYHKVNTPPGVTFGSSSWNPEQIDSSPNWTYKYSYSVSAQALAGSFQSTWTAAGCPAKSVTDTTIANLHVVAYCPSYKLYLDASVNPGGVATVQASENKISSAENQL